MPKITLGPNEIMKGWGTDFSSSNSQGLETSPGKYTRSTAISLFRRGKVGQVSPGEVFTAGGAADSRENA